jgi:hypothetical protein
MSHGLESDSFSRESYGESSDCLKALSHSYEKISVDNLGIAMSDYGSSTILERACVCLSCLIKGIKKCRDNNPYHLRADCT